MMVMVLRVALAASDGQQKNQLLPLAQILPVMALPRWGPRDLAQPQFPHLGPFQKCPGAMAVVFSELFVYGK